MNARTKDVTRELAGRAHADANPGAKRAARRRGHHITTECRHRRSGPPALIATYALNTEHKWRLVAHVKALAFRDQIEKESRAELVERIRELLREQKLAQGEDAAADLSRGVGMLDRAAQKERTAEIAEELSARFRRCAELGITEVEVFGR